MRLWKSTIVLDKNNALSERWKQGKQKQGIIIVRDIKIYVNFINLLNE